MTRPYHPNSARALATVFALVMVGLVTVSLTASAVMLRNDVLRVRTMESDAQLRQLLLAGTADAAAHASAWGEAMPLDTRWGLSLPHDPRLVGAAVTLESAPRPWGVVDVHIVATLDGRRAEETLQFRHTGGHSGLAETQLGPFSAAERVAKHREKTANP